MSSIAAFPAPVGTRSGREPSICLCMIVRNEARVLERCLDAVRPILDAASICDTGSTDGTAELAQAWLERNGVPGLVHRHAFRDFGHNRTLSMRAARETLAALGQDLDGTYLLFVDADMVLDVAAGFTRGDLSADVYSVVQRNAGLVYSNVRLARASLDADYVGATHEYFRAPAEATQAMLASLSIEDRNDGGSRSDKYDRDVRLLEAELARAPADGRSMFYLAQTYRGQGDRVKALFWYRRRIRTGGWAEELWYSQYAIGLLYLDAGETLPALRAFHAAIRMNPGRPEPYFHAARHLRSRGHNGMAARYAGASLALGAPAEGSLFVEQSVVWGLLRELSIAGYHSQLREQGFEANERLALGRDVPAELSALAAANAAFYARPLDPADVTYAPIAPALPAGFVPCNPSILRSREGYVINCRAVDYRINEFQHHVPTAPGGNLHTRNFRMRLGPDLEFQDQTEISGAVPPLRNGRVKGLEDCRLFEREGGVGFTCTTADAHPSGYVHQTLVAFDPNARITHHVPLSGYEDERHQKNWLPFVDRATGRLRVVYAWEPLVVLDVDAESGHCEPVVESRSGRPIGHFRGSAGPVELPEEEGRLFVVHEVAVHGRRYYLHRFVLVGADWRVERISRPFYFHHAGIEFACGACLSHDGREVLVTFGVEDREAWLCRIPLGTIRKMLRPLPEGEDGAPKDPGRP